MGRIRTDSDRVGTNILDLFASTLVWDNHACMPCKGNVEAFLPMLARVRDAGVDVVTLNVGYDGDPWHATISVLARYRHWLLERAEDYVLVQGISDIERARREHKLAVSFDIEGGCALNDQLSMVQLYYDLGVRWMLIAYNRSNSLGGGCNDQDKGLTAFGKRVIEEMGRVGMVVCCSHTGYRTTMDVLGASSHPVILSHSNPLAVWRHYRNVSDDVIKACAATGGVIGINGVGPFLGANDSSTETIVRHIDYVSQLVGVRHVGLGLDYTFDIQELLDDLGAHPDLYPAEQAGDQLRFVAPEQIPEIAEHLYRLGYSEGDLRYILGGNHLRIAGQVWRASSYPRANALHADKESTGLTI